MVVEPVMGRFLATYPEIRLEVMSFDGLVDIVAEGFDAGIRPDWRLAQSMIAVPVGPRRRFAAAGAPSYFVGRDIPRVPQDLHAHACIEHCFPSGSRYAWEFARGDEAMEVEISGPLVVDASALIVRAALDGIGPAFVYENFVAIISRAGIWCACSRTGAPSCRTSSSTTPDDAKFRDLYAHSSTWCALHPVSVDRRPEWNARPG